MFWNSCGACDAGVPLFVVRNCWRKTRGKAAGLQDSFPFAQRIGGEAARLWAQHTNAHFITVS